MANSTTSRRSILAGAAAVPALALPALATADDAELIALGLQLEPIIARWQAMVRADRAGREAFEQTVFEATGIRDEDWRAARDAARDAEGAKVTPPDFLTDPYLVERDRLAKLREETDPDPDPYLERYTDNQEEAKPI